MPKVCQILIVEDSRPDVLLIREALAAADIQAELHVVRDGEEAVRFLDAIDAAKNAPCPDLVLLDLNLPKRTGIEVLRHLREATGCGGTAVVIMTSSDSMDDRQSTASLGAREYFRKPSNYSEFMKLGLIVRAVLAD